MHINLISHKQIDILTPLLTSRNMITDIIIRSYILP